MTKKQSKVKIDPDSYLGRTLKTIVLQGEVRGIPEQESESVVASIQKKYGKKLTEMSERELVRVNQALDALFREYLGGMKRR